ncbi:MAG: preprotein translocase subunit SecG [Bacteroidota bacterium]|nr:preprotein translocase subunit SecG [Bacteroidota bacterium]MDP4191430.1 preprotein translocase subunit SecG [Bacteroidota bacterium]MDP4194377.1 preprotein translocase subunit SecG [Bacteroidota bacterium]
MYTLLVSLAVIVGVVLIIAVLLQSSKGGGLAGGIVGGAGSIGTMFGARRTADFLSKATWWLAGSLVVIILLINLFFLPGEIGAGSRDSIIQKGRQSVPTSPSVPGQQQRSK